MKQDPRILATEELALSISSNELDGEDMDVAVSALLTLLQWAIQGANLSIEVRQRSAVELRRLADEYASYGPPKGATIQ